MKNKSTLEQLLTNPRATEFFGRAFEPKFAALALAVRGPKPGEISAEARRLKISRQGFHKHFVRAVKFMSS